MKVGVVGAGAIGCLFGGLLQKTAHKVTFLARGAQLKNLNKNGLTIINEEKVIEHELDCTVTNDLEDMYGMDLILFCVKSTDTRNMAEQLKTIIDNRSIIITLQNGVDNEEVLSDIFSSKKVLSAAT